MVKIMYEDKKRGNEIRGTEEVKPDREDVQTKKEIW